MPPLRHAVRLVDGEHRDPGAAVEQPHGGVGPQPLGREVEQVELAGPELLLDDLARPRVLRRVEEVRADAELAQRLHLVLHERDERRDDHPGARPDQRGDLVAQRLAAAGRHQHERVVARDDVRDDLLLLRRGTSRSRTRGARPLPRAACRRPGSVRSGRPRGDSTAAHRQPGGATKRVPGASYRHGPAYRRAYPLRALPHRLRRRRRHHLRHARRTRDAARAPARPDGHLAGLRARPPGLGGRGAATPARSPGRSGCPPIPPSPGSRCGRSRSAARRCSPSSTASTRCGCGTGTSCGGEPSPSRRRTPSRGWSTGCGGGARQSSCSSAR